MKKLYGFYSILFTMMILLITGSAGAFFIGDGKGVYGGERHPGIKANEPFLKASTTLRDRETVPEGLTKTGWRKIRASIERYRYQLHKDDRTGAYQAANYAHDLHATFTRQGFHVSPRKDEKNWNWGLSLNRYGYGSDLNIVPETNKMITKGNRIEYHRGDLIEWYINDHRGLEQGFTLKTRPCCQSGSELLKLQMKTSGNLVPMVVGEGKEIAFRVARGNEVLRYSGLYAYDAAGKKLSAKMEAVQEGIYLIVADHDATYPITIDPFIERKKLFASDGADDDFFGRSVSINGDTSAVTAHGDDNGPYTGAVYIFYRDHGGADNWGQVKKLLASDGSAYDNFGSYEISISGDTIIVGAIGDDDKGSNSGSAYIFYRDYGGTDNWGQVKKLLSGVSAETDFFGKSVSISGDTVIVGANTDYDNGEPTGSAYIFSRDHGGADNWGQVKKLLTIDRATGDAFGHRVSISGDTAVVGAYGEDDNGERSGSAYIFYRDYGGTDNWGQVKKLHANDAAAYDDFGFRVSISGDTAIVGAVGNDDGLGAAYIFSRDHGGTDNWGQVKKITAPNKMDDDEFGESVSISGATAFVGACAYFADSDNGSAYIFSQNQGGVNNWGLVEILTASDGEDDDYFGGSVSISEGAAIVGASGDDDNGNNSGSAYIYVLEVPPGEATLISPSGTITEGNPKYTWSAVETATWYYLWVNDETGNMIKQWYTADDANCGDGTGECSLTSATELADGSCKWWIQTWNSSGYGPWSDGMSFTVITPSCTNIAGEWAGNWAETSCDSFNYSGSWTGTVTSGCTFTGTDNWDHVSGTIDPITMRITASGISKDGCGFINVTGTFISNSVSGNYFYSAGGGGTFSGSK